MTIISNSIIYNKYLRLLPETIEWLKQQSDLGQAINELVTNTRKHEQYIKRDPKTKALSEQEELYILKQKFSRLQNQLQNEIDRAWKSDQQLQDEKDKLTEQLEISQEQVKTLQKQLQDQHNCSLVIDN